MLYFDVFLDHALLVVAAAGADVAVGRIMFVDTRCSSSYLLFMMLD